MMISSLDVHQLYNQPLTSIVEEASQPFLAGVSSPGLPEAYQSVSDLLSSILKLEVEIEWFPQPSKRQARLMRIANKSTVEALDSLAATLRGARMELFCEIVRNECGTGHKSQLQRRIDKAAQHVKRVADAYAVLLEGVSDERAERASFEPRYLPGGQARGSVPFEL